SLWPALQRWLPRPGLWMERLKQFLAFPMFGAAVWLVWVLTQQAGSQGVVVVLSGMVALAFAAWLYGSTRQASALAQHGGSAVALLILLSVGSASYVMAQGTPPASTTEGEGPAWQPYSASRLQALRAEGRPVFIDLTAAWCLTCLVNERVALNQALVGQVFASHNVQALKGDWTNQDAEISALLRRFGRTGVPLYVFYPEGANSQPKILPQILTPDLVLSTVTRPAL
ncbi:MAG TPA: thioredoxin family protein, partial [Aquabacterium sp.]|nr:thioredoxin family protein [Aquabacterium sp.]